MIIKVPVYFEVEAQFTPEETVQYKEAFEDSLQGYLIKQYGSKWSHDTFLSKKVSVRPIRYRDVKKKLTAVVPKNTVFAKPGFNPEEL